MSRRLHAKTDRHETKQQAFGLSDCGAADQKCLDIRPSRDAEAPLSNVRSRNSVAVLGGNLAEAEVGRRNPYKIRRIMVAPTGIESVCLHAKQYQEVSPGLRLPRGSELELTLNARAWRPVTFCMATFWLHYETAQISPVVFIVLRSSKRVRMTIRSRDRLSRCRRKWISWRS